MINNFHALFSQILVVDMHATASTGEQLGFVHPLLFTLYCTNISMCIDLHYLNTFFNFFSRGNYANLIFDHSDNVLSKTAVSYLNL